MSPLERCELLTPVPDSEVSGRLADGQSIEELADGCFLVETIVLPVSDRGCQPGDGACHSISRQTIASGDTSLSLSSS